MKKSVVTLISLLCSISSFSQWTSNVSENTRVCNATGDQSEVRIVSDGSGGSIVAWTDARPAGQTDVYAQRVDAEGFVKWAATGVPICTTGADQSVPSLIEDGKGGAIFVWKDLRNGNSDIYAQHIDSLGTVLWTTAGIAVDTKNFDQIEPKILSDGANGAIVTWQDSINGNWDIYAQRINSDGLLLWGTGGIAVCSAINDQKNPRIEMSDSGEAIIVWQDRRNGNDYNIYAQKINAAGIPQWFADGVSVCASPNTQNNPKIESDGMGGAIIGWADKRSGSDYDIYAQRLSSGGVPLWVADGVPITMETGNQSALDISAENIVGAIFTWKDYRNNIYADIYAQYIDSSGTVQWTVNGVAVSTRPFDQINPNIIADSSGCIIVWQDSSASGQWDVYAQKIAMDGIVQWGNNGKVISNAVKSQIGPKHISDGKGGAFVVWEDNRDTTKFDIYIQNVNFDGSAGPLGIFDKDRLFPVSVFPNPGNGNFTFNAEYHPALVNGVIFIYNSLGENIYRASIPEGTIQIDLTGYPKGIYLYRLWYNEIAKYSGKLITY